MSEEENTKDLNQSLNALKWRHKLLDSFLKTANSNEISSHVRQLMDDADELTVLLPEPVEEATTQLLSEIKRDCSLILKACNSQVRSDDGPSTSKQNSNVKLPKLNINSFDGNDLAWLSWWDQFSSTIHENSELTDAVRVQYLATSLVGAAKDSTNQFPFVASSYNTIIQYLKTTYGDIVKLRSIYSNAITNMPFDSSIEGMRKNLDNLVAYLKHLKKFDPSQTLEHYLGHVLSKFTDEIRRSAYLYLDIKEIDQNIDNVLVALDRVLKYEEKIRSLLRTLNTNQSSSIDNRPNVVFTSPAPPKKHKRKECIFCSQIHSSKNCRQVITSEGRRRVLSEKNICWMCLGSGHDKLHCQQNTGCSYCRRNDHNVALCYQFLKTLGPNTSNSANTSYSSPSPYKKHCKGIFLQTFTCSIFHNQEYHILRGVLDNCAHKSFINFDVLQRFNLTGPKIVSSICSFATDVPHSFLSQKITIRLFNKRNQFRMIEFCSTPIIAPKFDSAPSPDICRRVLPLNLNYADDFLFCYDKPNIDLLVGNDFYNLIVNSRQTKTLSNNLIILETFFGFIPSGNLEGEPSCSSAVLVTVKPKTNFSIDEDVNFVNINKMYSLESLGIDSRELDTTDELILQDFRSKKTYIDSRVVVSWPWKSTNPKLNSNFRLARGRLKSLFESSKKDDLVEVDKIIQGQITEGILEVAPKTSSRLKHYLPHRPLKQKGKIRIVNDASAHSKSMPSLNDLLHKGPSLIKDVVGLILRFRWKMIAVTSDIEKAFHQMVLNEVDRDVVRILWVKDVNLPPMDDNIIIYRYVRVPFGVNASPFLLNIVIQDLFATPPVTQMDNLAALSFYVDNCLCSFENLVEAQCFYDCVMKRMKSVKFNLRDWLSNDKQFHLSVPQEVRAPFESTSVLGIMWDPKFDSLSLKFELREMTTWTKASILSTIASIYDPLGWISPCLLEAKLFMQNTWSLNKQVYNWSTELPEQMLHDWLPIFSDMKNLENFKLPRFLWTIDQTNNCTYEMHIFADASKDAYACVVYFVKRSIKGVESSLIFSKLKLAPKKIVRSKELSIPRLELMGVFLATKIKTFLMEQLKVFHSAIKEIIIWTDSSTILQWLSSPKVQCIFVQNRLAEIRKHKDVEFRHVRTSYNPADIPTRGSKIGNLIKSNLWWTGPNWLIDHSQRPEPPPNVPNFLPKTCDIVFLTLDIPVKESLISDSLEKRFSSWHSYIRVFKIVVAYCLMSTLGRITRLSESEQSKRAEHLIFIELQHKYFAKQIVDLRNKIQPCPKLNYFIHSDGLIRCKGRLNSSTLPFEVANPILLPKCHLTRVLINYLHTKNLHIGSEHTLAKLREKFWIIGARPLVKSVIHKCLICRRWQGGSFSLPPMPPLPSVRTTEVAAFLHSAVDLFGPLYYLNDMGETVKGWVCIFVCLVTRAIHLELVRDQSGNELLLALSRFTSRRGMPKFMISDNGSNLRFIQPLVGYGKPIRISDFKINKFLSSNSIELSFIPALAPWFGGAYERLIKLVKDCLKKSFGFNMLIMVELQTVLCQIEDIVNSRPLSYIPSEIVQPLTPNNFLRLRDVNIDTRLEVSIDKVPLTSQHLLQGWKKVNSTLEHFWSQFRSLYLLNLRQFQTQLHRKEKGSLNRFPVVNEVVLLREPSAPRGDWSIGKVIKVDKKQATASILLPNRRAVTYMSARSQATPRTIVERSIRLLHPLEMSPIDS